MPVLIAAMSWPADAACRPSGGNHGIEIGRLAPDANGGLGYRLTYCLAAPVKDVWRFKTNFGNPDLVRNPSLAEHRFVGRTRDKVLTLDRYTFNPRQVFLWQTTVFRRDLRLAFKLLNPVQSGQSFHYGVIRLSAQGQHTLVLQEARFKFPGAALWTRYPWQGGMRAVLTAFARWEQQMVNRP